MGFIVRKVGLVLFLLYTHPHTAFSQNTENCYIVNSWLYVVTEEREKGSINKLNLSLASKPHFEH